MTGSLAFSLLPGLSNVSLQMPKVTPTGLAGFSALRALTLRHMRDSHWALQVIFLHSS